MTRSTPRELVDDFVECINRGDVAGLGALMTDDHELRVFDEEPLRGKQAHVVRGSGTRRQEFNLIWLAEVSDGLVRSWTLVEDTPHARRELGLAGTA